MQFIYTKIASQSKRKCCVKCYQSSPQLVLFGLVNFKCLLAFTATTTRALNQRKSESHKDFQNLVGTSPSNDTSMTKFSSGSYHSSRDMSQTVE